MKIRKKVYLLFVLTINIIIFSSFVVNANQEKGISRATVAKIISLTYSDTSAIPAFERIISFSDVSETDWFFDFVNVAVTLGFFENGELFELEKNITYSEALQIFEKINIEKSANLFINVESNSVISEKEFVKTFFSIIGNSSDYGVSIIQRTFLGTNQTDKTISANNAVTDRGAISVSGFNVNELINKTVKIYYKNNELLGIESLITNEPVIFNVYVNSVTSTELTFSVGGITKSVPYSNEINAKINKGAIIDFQMTGSKIKILNSKNDILKGTIKRLKGDIIELEVSKNLSYTYNSDNLFSVYSTSDGKVSWKSQSSLIPGNNNVEFITKDGRIYAAVITKGIQTNNIRVVLGTTGYSGFLHNSFSITSDKSYNVVIGKQTLSKKAGEVYTLNYNETPDLFGQNRLYVIPSDKNAKFEIKSIRRNWGTGNNPKYRGIIELSKEKDGFYIVNELPFEEYLFSVVPSEMPSVHGLEVAKVQAITARSYAYNQFFSSRYQTYGANVDDSVSTQVYNNVPENTNSIKAVNETKGQLLAYKGGVISANFFSTSAGMTANSGEVWSHHTTKVFPTASSAYLKSTKQYSGADYGDLRNETNAEKFFKATNIKSYDSSFPWFRWNVEMSVSELEAAINKNLQKRYEANNRFVKTLQSDGSYKSDSISTIGKLIDFNVVERGEGGNIMILELKGSENTVRIFTEYNIRMLLTPVKIGDSGKDVVINRHDGSMVKNYSLMPSTFFFADKKFDKDETLSSIVFYGGGNGHGVGMSQNGVRGMIDDGFNYKQILQHYYKGTEIIIK